MKKKLLILAGLSMLFACSDPATSTTQVVDATQPEVPISETESSGITQNQKEKWIAELSGKWEIAMTVTQNSCDASEVTISKSEKMEITHNGDEVLVQIEDKNDKVNSFKGLIQDNKLILEGDKLEEVGVYEIDLSMLDSNDTFSGKKSVVYPGPCSIDYKFNGKKL